MGKTKNQINQYEQRIIAIEKEYEEGGDEKKCQEMNEIKSEIGNERVMKKNKPSHNEEKERNCFNYLINRINEMGKEHLIFGKVN